MPGCWHVIIATMSDIRAYADKSAMTQAAAQYVIEAAAVSITERERFTIALAGGSTPKALYTLLATELKDQVDWAKVHLFWGDERTVPPDHDDSNYRMVAETLLKGVDIPTENIHRVEAERDPHDAADAYEATLRSVFGDDIVPSFDLILLGIGGDGHTASLFPGTDALDIEDRWFVANHVPKLDTWRLTLTKTVINAAHRVVFLVAGESKADALREVLNGPYIPETYPSQLVEPEDGELVWFVDEAAASLL